MVSEDRLPRQFFAVQDKDEKFIWIGEPKFVPFVCTGIPLLAFGTIWDSWILR